MGKATQFNNYKKKYQEQISTKYPHIHCYELHDNNK